MSDQVRNAVEWAADRLREFAGALANLAGQKQLVQEPIPVRADNHYPRTRIR